MTDREQQLIAAILQHHEPNAIRVVLQDVPVSAFSCELGQEAWKHISSMVEMDTLCMIELFNRMGKDRVAPLYKGAPVNSPTLGAWGDEVKTDAYGRDLRRACYIVSTDDSGTPPTEAHASLDNILARCRADYAPTLTHSISDVVEDFDAFGADVREKRESGSPLRFGIDEIDRHAILIPSYGLFLARTSHGKTALACNVALTMATDGRKPVYVSGEQPARQIVGRLLSIMCGVDLPTTMGLKPALPHEIEGLQHAKTWLRKSGLTIIDGRRTVANIAATAGRLRLQGRCDCLFIDQMSCIDHQQYGRESKEQAWTRTSNALRLLWQEIDAPVILLAQLNSKDAKEHPAPHQSHIKDCGSLLEDTDWQLLIDRPEQDAKRFDAMEKQRKKLIAEGNYQDAEYMDSRGKVYLSCTKDRTSMMGGEWKPTGITFDTKCGGIGRTYHRQTTAEKEAAI